MVLKDTEYKIMESIHLNSNIRIFRLVITPVLEFLNINHDILNAYATRRTFHETNLTLIWVDPKLIWDGLLGQTSNLGCVEPINWIRPKSNFTKFSPRGLLSLFWGGLLQSASQPFFVLSRLIVEGSLLERQDILYCITGVHEHPWQFGNINITYRTYRTIQTHSDKLNWARRRTVREINSLSLVRRLVRRLV